MRNRQNPTERLRRLRLLLGLLFIGLALPAAVLIRQGFDQIQIAEFRRQQLIAEDLVRGIDNRLTAAIAVEDGRPVTDFDYAVTTSIRGENALQLSPLSSLAAASTFPGTIGYFQVDASGKLSTPLLPESDLDSLPPAELNSKMQKQTELANVLEANRLVEAGVEAEAGAGAEPRLEERTEQNERALFRSASVSEPGGRISRSGQERFDELAGIGNAATEDAASATDQIVVASSRVAPGSARDVRISTFAGDVEPLRFSLLATGHFVLFRNAWRDGERFIQGLLIDRESLIDETFRSALADARLAPGTGMKVSTADNPILSMQVLRGAGNERVDGSSLYQTRLSPPLAGIEIAFTSGALDHGPGFGVLAWTAVALFGVLVGGFVAMYRFGVQQMHLARQQQNFVSAVSHELKTPLTSIRMYGEILKSGWADDQKKQQYYDYIFDEGERLSRLIDNVLQLARLNRSGPAIALKPVAVGELLDVMRSKLSTQAERAGFELGFELEAGDADAVVSVDIDAFVQVFINLIDNAIKFSAEAESRRILITARCRDRGRVVFSVRDFGPGIPPAAMKRLFELFYRPDNELTRTTAGTGIGLALVKQLVTAMSGRVDARNREPGAEFQLEFPLLSAS